MQNENNHSAPQVNDDDNSKIAKANRGREFWFSLAFFLIALLIGLYYLSPFGTVKEIIVHSNWLGKEEIQKATGIKTGDQLWRVFLQGDAIEARAVNSNKQIKTLNTSVSGGVVTFNVTENVLPGFVVENGKTYSLTLAGKKNFFNGSVPTGATFYSGFKNDEDLKMAIANFAKMSFPIRQNVSQIQFAPDDLNPQRVIFYLNDGNLVFANLADFDEKFKYYPAMAAQIEEPSVVDLQFSAFSRPIQDADRNITAK